MWQPGQFVDNPIPTSGPIPHWSRWERSVTTFGPVGRIVGTALFLLTIPAALSAGAYLYVLFLPVTAYMVLPAIWAKGYVVPGAAPVAGPAHQVDRPQPHPGPPRTKAMLAWRGAWMSAVFAGCVIFAYAPSVEAKAAVLGLAAIVGAYVFVRGFLAR